MYSCIPLKYLFNSMLDLVGGFKNLLKVYEGYRSCHLGNIQKKISVPCVKKNYPQSPRPNVGSATSQP